MKLIIDIPEHCFEELKCIELNESNEGVVFHSIKCILNGTPLPKGHGRLIDADALLKRHLGADYDCRITRNGIEFAPTIIEADKESEVEDAT